MELNLNHETIRLNKLAYDGTMEQTIEHEYQLPDYYPSIFKLLKCFIEPHICACRTSGEQLVVDGVVVAKMLYADEEGGGIHSIIQKLPFSKTLELKGPIENPTVDCKVSTDYINCRIISSRKIDIRGSLTIWIKVQTQDEEVFLKDAEGSGIQLNKHIIPVCGDKIWANRQFSVSEQFEVKNQIEEILETNFIITVDSCKLISNKAIIKGNGNLTVIYRNQDGNIQEYKNNVPISQIIDMPSVDEDYISNADFDVTSVDATLTQEGSVLNINADVTVNCIATLLRDISIISDGYSTEFEIKTTVKEVSTPATVAFINENLISEQTFDVKELKEIYCIKSNISDLVGTKTLSGIKWSAKMELSLMGMDSEGDKKIIDHSIPIEFTTDAKIDCNNPEISAKVKISSCDYSFNDGKVELKANINLNGIINCIQTFKTISDLVLNEEKPHTRTNAALTLYYPETGDSVFNIAKQFLTSPKAIKEANGLESEEITGRTMIMIPIVK